MKKNLIILTYWIAAILLLATIVMSTGCPFADGLFIGVMFLPGALAVKYLFPKISFRETGSGIRNAAFVIMGIICAEILLIVLAHRIIHQFREGEYFYYNYPEIPDVLVNPVFIAIMIAVLAVASYFLNIWLDKVFPTAPEPVTFLSDRKNVSLDPADILYVESNDSITLVVAADGTRYRNKTPISHWEAILGDSFIRIHRSYLVNRSAIESVESDVMTVGGQELPISRKYRSRISNIPGTSA